MSQIPSPQSDDQCGCGSSNTTPRKYRSTRLIQSTLLLLSPWKGAGENRENGRILRRTRTESLATTKKSSQENAQNASGKKVGTDVPRTYGPASSKGPQAKIRPVQSTPNIGSGSGSGSAPQKTPSTKSTSTGNSCFSTSTDTSKSVNHPNALPDGILNSWTRPGSRTPPTSPPSPSPAAAPSPPPHFPPLFGTAHVCLQHPPKLVSLIIPADLLNIPRDPLRQVKYYEAPSYWYGRFSGLSSRVQDANPEPGLNEACTMWCWTQLRKCAVSEVARKGFDVAAGEYVVATKRWAAADAAKVRARTEAEERARVRQKATVDRMTKRENKAEEKRRLRESRRMGNAGVQRKTDRLDFNGARGFNRAA